MSTFDVVIIGAGPGGYVAAIRCAQLGLSTLCVERGVDTAGKPVLGGTCLNVGCIPSKALLDTSHLFHDASHLLPAHGITVQGVTLDLAAVQTRKRKVVENLTRGIAGLFRKNKIERRNGSARLLAGRRVEIRAADGSTETVDAAHIIIATGSVPVQIPVAPLDGEHIVDSEGALAFDAVPARLGIVGAGVIGLELGSVWSRFGAEVVVLEALPDFLASVDREIATAALKSLRKQGLDIRLGCRVSAARAGESTVALRYEDGDGSHSLEVDRLVVAVGRRPCTEGLGAAEVGLELDGAGRIVVDAHSRTNLDGVYAVGDVVAGPMLAHKASEEGLAVAEMIAGGAAHIDHALVPWVIYTHPEIAWVGKTEQALREEGVAYRTGSFPYLALGRAQGAGQTEGLVKMLACAQTDRILGVHIFGASASELVAEAVTAMAMHASSEDIARIVHAHPTLSEAMHEAALAVDGRAIHF